MKMILLNRLIKCAIVSCGFIDLTYMMVRFSGNEIFKILVYVAGFVFQRFKFPGILQHYAWYNRQFATEGKRW